MSVLPRRTAPAEASDRWFLPDQPQTETDGDAFAHDDIADNLKAMIQQSRSDKGEGRLAIGLLGPFGVGKSTVIELLRGKLRNDPDDVVVRLSAERHLNDVGLQRSLIYALAEVLEKEPDVDPVKVGTTLRDLQHHQTTETLDLLNLPLRGLGPAFTTLGRLLLRTAKRFFLWALALFFFAMGVGYFATGKPLAAVGPIAAYIVFFAPLAGTLAALVVALLRGDKLAEALTTPPTISMELPRAEAADEFERTFADLVKLCPRRLVIAIDDIDRLAPDRVLDALNAIRSFQLTCRSTGKIPVFIISCDERVIAKAIEKADPSLASVHDGLELAVSAFLDRLFTQRQFMPAHPYSDLVAYARRILTSPPHAGAEALGGRLDSVLAVLVHDGVHDPRHVIRLLNNFFGDLRLATRRENSTNSRSMSSGEVTSKPHLMARMSVLRVDFPEFYAALREDEALIELLEKSVVDDSALTEQERARLGRWAAPSSAAGAAEPGKDPGGGTDESQREKAAIKNHSLRLFVGRTRGSAEQADSLVPFLYLGLGELDRVLGTREARDAQRLLVNGQIDDLRKTLVRFQEEADADDVEKTGGRQAVLARASKLTELFVQNLRSLTGDSLATAVTSVAGVSAHLMPSELSPVADAVAVALSQSASASLDVQDMVRLGGAATSPDYQQRLATHALHGGAGQTSEQLRARALAVAGAQLELGAILGEATVTQAMLAELGDVEVANSVELLRPWMELANSPAGLPASVSSKLSELILPTAATTPDNLDTGWVDAAIAVLARSTPEARAAHTAIKALMEPGISEEPGRLAVGAAALLAPDPKQDAAFVIAVHSSALDEDGTAKDGVLDQTAGQLMDLVSKRLEQYATYVTGGDTKLPVPLLAAKVVAALHSEDLPGAAQSVSLRRAVIQAFTSFAPAHMAPLVEEVLSEWPGEADTDRRGFADVVAALDVMPQENADAVLAELTRALTSNDEQEHAAGTVELLAVLRTARGQAGAPTLIAGLLSRIAATSDANVTRAMTTINSVFSAGLGTDAEATQVLNALAALQSSGGNWQPLALSMMCKCPWPGASLEAAAQRLQPYVAQLTVPDLDALLDTLADGRDCALGEVLEEALVARVLAGASSDPAARASQHAAGLAAVVTSERLVRIVLGFPLVSARLVELTQSMDEPAQQAFARTLTDAAVVQLGKGGDGATAAVQALAGLAAALPEAYESVVEALLGEHFQGLSMYPADIWAALLAPCPTASIDRVGTLAHDALGGSADAALRAARLVTVAGSLPLLAERLAVLGTPQQILRWVEAGDVDTARAVAAALGSDTGLRVATRALFKTQPKKGQASREAWDAAKAAVS